MGGGSGREDRVEAIRMVRAEVVEIDTERVEAKVEITLSASPSDYWLSIFQESTGDGVDPRDIKLSDNTLIFWHRAEAGVIAAQADALRRLIEHVNVKVELAVRTARQREEHARHRMQELSRALQQRLGLPG